MRRLGVALGIAVTLVPLLAACSKGLTPSAVDLTCPSHAGGPVTLAVGARANSPAPVLPPVIVDLIREAAESIKGKADDILNRVRLARKGIEDQVDKLREVMSDLKSTKEPRHG